MAVLKVQTYETVDAGMYPARVADVVWDENGQFGPQVKAIFELTEEEVAGKTLVGWASAKLSPKSKLYGWVSALLFRGKGIPEGYPAVDTDTLKGWSASWWSASSRSRTAPSTTGSRMCCP